MAANIVRLKTRPARLRSETAAELRWLIEGLPERARGEIIAAIDRETASEAGWTFVMIGPEQNAAVVRWLRQHSRYKTLAPALWAELFTALRRDTGEIMLTRDELAERVGAGADEVSRVMGELARVGAVIVRRERVAGMRGPGRAVYLMNPNVATNLTGAARDKAQAEAPRLQLVE
jgi:predicted transcriptional regulator